jgi:hypothetical protein
VASNAAIMDVEAFGHARARTVARSALRRPEWAFWCVTGWPSSRHDEARVKMMTDLRIHQLPKTAPILTCGRPDSAGTRQAKLMAVVEIVSRASFDNLVVYDVDRDQLDLYAGWLASRRQPYRWTMYWVSGPLVAPYRSTAVHAQDVG